MSGVYNIAFISQIVDEGVRQTRNNSRNTNNRNTTQLVESSDDNEDDDEDDNDIESAELPVVAPNVRAERSTSPYRDAAPIDINQGPASNEKVTHTIIL